MAKEIEYKFLLESVPKIPAGVICETITQGYLSNDDGSTVRVRIATLSSSAGFNDAHASYITIKGKQVGITRDEFEYHIPEKDAREMLLLCKGRIIKKSRYPIYHNRRVVELDVFHDDFEGLVIAEVEVSSEDEAVNLPDYFGKTVDVSRDFGYTNASLSKYGMPK